MNDKPQTHRCAVVSISGSLIADIMIPGNTVLGDAVVLAGLRDVRVRGVDYDEAVDTVRLIVESPDLPPVAVGDALPDFTVRLGSVYRPWLWVVARNIGRFFRRLWHKWHKVLLC